MVFVIATVPRLKVQKAQEFILFQKMVMIMLMTMNMMITMILMNMNMITDIIQSSKKLSAPY